MVYDTRLLSAALDDGAFPVLDELMEYFAPQAPFLTFGGPDAARALAFHGKTVLADREAFDDPMGMARENGIEVRSARIEDPLVFPPRRFGLVHARWTSFTGAAMGNLVRWVRPNGVLLIEGPDCYPAVNMARGPYRNVASAVADRLGAPVSADLPALLIRHGFMHVGSRHQLPVASAFQALLQNLIERGAPWPELAEADLRDWPHDPVTRTPALTNVLAWGMKPGEDFTSGP